jgi:hypothetical protein
LVILLWRKHFSQSWKQLADKGSSFGALVGKVPNPRPVSLWPVKSHFARRFFGLAKVGTPAQLGFEVTLPTLPTLAVTQIQNERV